MSDQEGPPAVQAALRSLRLPGMADMLGQRLARAAAGGGGLGHAELLALLIGDEQTRRYSTGLARRLAAAHFESTCAVEDYDFAFNPQIPAGTIRDLTRLQFLTAGLSIILHGRVGVGKTMIAQALGQLACRRGHTVLFTKTSRLLADLSGGHADRTWNTRLKHWARPALLICDDFAMRELTSPQADDLYELITERAGRSLIITSNRTLADWYPLFPNPVVAESVLDRLVNTTSHIQMPGRSYRPSHRPGQPDSRHTNAGSGSGSAGRGQRGPRSTTTPVARRSFRHHQKHPPAGRAPAPAARTRSFGTRAADPASTATRPAAPRPTATPTPTPGCP